MRQRGSEPACERQGGLPWGSGIPEKKKEREGVWEQEQEPRLKAQCVQGTGDTNVELAREQMGREAEGGWLPMRRWGHVQESGLSLQTLGVGLIQIPAPPLSSPVTLRNFVNVSCLFSSIQWGYGV